MNNNINEQSKEVHQLFDQIHLFSVSPTFHRNTVMVKNISLTTG